MNISGPTAEHVEILIVEDSPTQAEMLRLILEDHGYRFSIVRNGREALEAIGLRKPTLVISDIVMPEMDGYELCRHLKESTSTRDIPVILLTSLSDPTDVVRGLESGADSFIFKPYDEQYLLARVAYTLANQHLRASEFPQMGVEIFFAGRKFFITSDRLQILNLLLSTYEAAVQKNRELTTAQDELRHLNEHLETKVAERTVALESEVAERKKGALKLEAQLARMNLLHQITRAIGERQDLQSIFQVVIGSIEDSLRIDFGCIGIFEPLENSLVVSGIGARSRSFAEKLGIAEQSRIPIDHNGLSRCVNGRLVHEPDISGSQFPFPQRLVAAGLRALVVAPLLVESKVFGVLIAARREANTFSSGECEFLQQLSGHVALAAHQAQLYASLQQAYSDLHRTQQAVMQQERLRALGQMASGIAHDINNAISPIALYTESLLEKEPGLSDRGRNYLETIQQAIDDVAATVARMREFYRQREALATLAPVQLNKLVQQVMDLTRASWKDLSQQRGIMIDMRAALDPNLREIVGVESEIRDALTNLLLNAVDAMPKGGRLTLSTSETVDGSTHDVRVAVSDTGIGMSEETRRRCLEPFFTTKGERGTGLGLAMVYGMVQRHNSRIEIDSTPGEGTTIRLIFPIPNSQPATAATDAGAPVLDRRLRILIVDDDPLLIKSLRDALEGDGHQVVAANGGQGGIDAFRESLAGTERFAAVITDLGMPYVDGRKVAAAIKEASPATPVILLTGWGQRMLEENDIPENVDRVLRKPPRLREVRAALAACVANAESNASI
ncbi:MAG TPA: response regulator [Chthoniobacteraceae bacterium]|jgi:DNA-binding response OmpR family regulator/signal transduction histidine kinase|nr:response regulator [Chthoniobacteraceae bacterium]